MVTIKKNYATFICCLAALLTFKAHGNNRELKAPVGTVTQMEGEVTFLPYSPPFKTTELELKGALLTGGSYLTQDNSFFTVQTVDGSWLRISPKTKFAVDMDAETKALTIHLFTGSIKVLFSRTLNQGKMEKILVKSADSIFETSESKFSIVRNPIMNETSLYVEKGMVSANQIILEEKKDMALVHTNETVSIADRNPDIPEPRKLNEKEVKWLHSKSYLKKEQTQAME